MALVTKKKPDNTVTVYSIPDDVLAKYEETPDTIGTSSSEQALDLYKMEYERCAQRYDDLYQAAWTNFSYIALIAGAILTFGNDSFMTELSIFVATLPLLFWWIATFEPLNRYGDQVQARAGVIEKLINELVGFSKMDDIVGQKGLRHFQDYERRLFRINWGHLASGLIFWIAFLLIVLHKLFDLFNSIFWVFPVAGIIGLIIWWYAKYKDATEPPKPPKPPSKFWQHLLRVRLIVRTFAGAIIIVAICSAYGAYRRHQPPSSEAYIKSSKSDSKLPERLTIKVEK